MLHCYTSLLQTLFNQFKHLSNYIKETLHFIFKKVFFLFIFLSQYNCYLQKNVTLAFGQYSALFYCNLQYSIVLYCAVLYSVVLYYTERFMYCTVLKSMVLKLAVLYCSTLIEILYIIVSYKVLYTGQYLWVGTYIT